MPTKLNTFWEFTQTLYPHEIEYLLSVQNFSKEVNVLILNKIHANSLAQAPSKNFDTKIDKRTYSYIKKWIQDTLSKIDVDIFFEWLITTERKILTDIIVPADEAEILVHIKIIKPTYYYFIRFYELLQYYRDYLLVRNRTKHNKVVSDYLDEYQDNYHKSTEVNRQLNIVAAQIVTREITNEADLLESEAQLAKVYYDENLDAYTRYRAVVRLTIYYYNNRQFDKLLVAYEHLEECFKTPIFYSKRLLANYYANRAMMHLKLNELEQAEKYGYLSIKNNNSDYLLYLINLCGVLLKQGKKAEVYELMRNAIPEIKNTNNNYYKIGFVAFYIRTLIINENYDKAVEYATGYFDAYKKEIFEHRWHLFFCAYLQALVHAEKYTKVLALCRRYKLVEKEKQRIDRADYLPTIQFYAFFSEYSESIISKDKFIASIIKASQHLVKEQYHARKIFELLDELAQFMPEEIKHIKNELEVG